MPATITKTIKSAGGDYSSLSAFEALDRDIVANDEVMIADCYDLSDTTEVNFTGWTTDSTRYIIVQSNVPHGGIWNTSAYRLTSAFTVAINIGVNYTRIQGIQITGTGSGDYGSNGIKIANGVTNVIIERNLIRSTYTGAQGSGTHYGIDVSPNLTAHKISNNIIYGFANSGNNGKGLNSGIYAASYIYNNTVFNCDVGVADGGPGALYKNNIVKTCDTDWSVSAVGTSNNNCSEDGTHPGTSGQTGAVTFVSEAGGSENLHLASGDTVAKANGADLSGDASYPISVDIDNVVRSGTWSIGADQFIATATAIRSKFTLLGIG